MTHRRLVVPKVARNQALSCTTFKPPPLDGTLSVPQMCDWHYQNSPDHALFCFSRADGSAQTIYWPEAVHAIWVGAKILRDRFNWVPGAAKTPVIAILATSDTISYFTMINSCFRANYTVFPISPRNSPAAVAHLLDKVGVKRLLIGQEPSMQDLLAGALNILREKYPETQPPNISQLPLFEDLFLPENERILVPESVPYEYMGPDSTLLIVHSSGSTSFPKPIYWSNQRCLETALFPWFGERDLTNQRISLHATPMYHIMGILQVFWSASAGLVITSNLPRAIPLLPTAEAFFDGAKATNTDILLSVPSFIETWASKPECVRWLAGRTGILYSGGPLNKEIGNFLISQGVTLFIQYGLSEAGMVSLVLPSEIGPTDWEYFTFPSVMTPEMIPHGNDTFELVMVSNEFYTPAVTNTTVRGKGAFATSDLLLAHPTKPGHWKVYGRTDDQIMHSTGEKPSESESLLNQDPHVRSSVIFGRGRFQAGVIVEPQPAYKFDPEDQVKLAEFRNMIWNTVVKMNEIAPQHSRLFKEMIIVVKPDKPFTYTAKMTVRRASVIADYEKEIDALYKLVDDSTSLNDILPPTDWSQESVRNFVRAAIHSVLTHEVGDEEDIFQHGCDSLQATWIRNALLHALREHTHLDTRRHTKNFVYEYPSVARLGAYLYRLGDISISEVGGGEDGEEVESVEAKTHTMHAMVAKYTGNLRSSAANGTHPPLIRGGEGMAVLVTGTTGGLGCCLLAQLLQDPRVSKVYAFNRAAPGAGDLFERQKRMLVERGLDGGILGDEKLALLEGDLSESDLGVSEAVYEELYNRVTHIIHSAWPVNFSITLSSFERNIKGLRNLIDFSLASEPRTLLYTSSIGVFHTPPPAELHSQAHGYPEIAINAGVAAGNGYEQSKWVSEEMLRIAAAAHPTKAKLLVVRVGQLCGGINGSWNAQEWLPAVIQSGKITGCLPDDSRDVSWIPVHVAAAALIDFLDLPTGKILHLINPRSVPWRTLAAAAVSALDDAPIVPYAEWLGRLETAVREQPKSATTALRATHLLDFFRSLREERPQEEAFGLMRLDMANALAASKTLRDVDFGLSGKDMEQWMKYWRGVGLF
ncbi:acetyl-CoA synthetase-like protein [Favolaschia claudopus]|uniref:Acetyl-CoA synthetase-like protein n=1 Tax=Favolaschia claudopus TaxID=2862362 RepID=A0AAV9ZKR0_9AGAR